MPASLKVRRAVATLRSGARVRIPAWELDSGIPGPRLLLTAALHGNEVIGGEVIRRFLGIAARRRVRGKVCAIPFANLPAVRERRPHIHMGPEQAYGDHRGYDMNLVWPGDRDGNDTERVAFALNRTFADDATHVFDIHSYNKHQAGDVMVRDVPALRDQAARLGHRFVMLRPFPPGKLVSHFYDTGRAGVLYNASGQYLVSEAEVRRALRVLENYAKVIGVLAGPLARGDDPVLFSDTTERIDVVAPTSGLFMDAGLKLCEEVAEGALFGHLLSDRDLQCREIRSPVRGYLRVYGVARPHCDVALPGHHPYVTKGERLAQIVRPIGAEEGPAGERFRSPLSSGLEQIPG